LTMLPRSTAANVTRQHRTNMTRHLYRQHDSTALSPA
jgi:hypothetical protein